jgi:hypothetical protein
MQGDKELAWLFRQYQKMSSSFPFSMSDYFDVPDWFVGKPDSEDSPMTQMVEIAQERSYEILYEK